MDEIKRYFMMRQIIMARSKEKCFIYWAFNGVQCWWTIYPGERRFKVYWKSNIYSGYGRLVKDFEKETDWAWVWTSEVDSEWERERARECVFACSIECFHLFEKYLNDKCHFQIDGDTWSALLAIEIK